jgi:hypothetical protein
VESLINGIGFTLKIFFFFFLEIKPGLHASPAQSLILDSFGKGGRKEKERDRQRETETETETVRERKREREFDN